jgi:GTP cyclohydrolase I
MDAVVKSPAPPSRTRPTRAEAEEAVRVLLRWAGEDPSREGLLETPQRVAKAYEELFAGYGQDAAQILSKVFNEAGGYSEPVLVRAIPFHTHCEHHMVPFFGHAHIAYYPGEGITGLSKLARVVEVFARRFQTQEVMTMQIARAIEDALQPRGVAVWLEAEHLCMSMRGVQKQGSQTVTTHYTGLFHTDPAAQVRFMTMIRGG